MATRAEIELAAVNLNVLAFLRAIRLGEGTADPDGYRRIVGGELFDSFADHPRKRVWIAAYKVWSSAAGAYQFIASTWDEMRAKYALPDFSPASQDLAAVALIDRRGALADVISGRIEQAIVECRLEWASLPGSPYGQRTEKLEAVLAEYRKYGGLLEGQQPAPIVESKPTWEAPMSPFIAAAMPPILDAVPELIKIFGSGSAVSERNARAAEKVVQIAQTATGATNAQAVAEVIQSDPQARQAVIDAVRAQYLEIEEASAKSVAAAREFNANWRGGQPFISTRWLTLQFVEFLSLVLVAISAGGAFYVLGGDPAAFSPDIKASVVTLILIGGFTGVLTFWLGSSRDSQRKTEILGR